MDEFRKYKPMVYVCSPYSGDTQFNTAQAKKYSRFAYEQGAIPMTPHLLYPQFMCDENPAERSDAFQLCASWQLLGTLGVRQQSVRWHGTRNRYRKEEKADHPLVQRKL